MSEDKLVSGEQSDGLVEKHEQGTRRKNIPISSPRANTGVILIPIIIIGLLWVGMVLLWYVASGSLSFLGLLVSSIVTLLTLVGAFWPVFIGDVVKSLKRRYGDRGVLLRNASLATCVLFVFVSIGVFYWRFDPYYHLGWLKLDSQLNLDSELRNNDLHWHSHLGNNSTVGSCFFENDGYHVTAYPNHTHNCITTSTNFDNFVYEVKMNLNYGECGGIVFRADYTSYQQYYFRVCQDHTYCLIRSDGFSNNHSVIGCTGDTSGLETILKDGPYIAQSLTLAVVARGNNIELWVNHQQLDVGFDFSDQELKEGEIGVAVSAITQPTEATFSDAKVWSLNGG